MDRSRSLLMVAFALSLLAYCTSDKMAPTGPSGGTPTAVPGVTMTGTSGPTTTPTEVPPTPTTVPTSTAARVVEVGLGGTRFVDSRSGSGTTTIHAGETVEWQWIGAFHSSTSGTCCRGDGVWDSSAMSTGVFRHTFPTVGQFPYFCMVHGAAMTGVVVVTP